MHLADLNWSTARTALTRRKRLPNNESNSKLAKVLTTLDLTALGVGSTLGVGVYVLAGDVAKNTAGPAVTISFLIAALASILAGLCYAEFGARVPKAGSAYVYSYVCIGELFAFIIGWNLILEYLIGSATVVKALFLYLDELANNAMSSYFVETMPMSGGPIGVYADVFSLGLSLLMAVAIAFGAKESTFINNILTFVNLTVVTVVMISGLWKVKVSNWSIPSAKVPAHKCGVTHDGDCGNGGFAPYGIRGVIKGAARCFFGFIGFDCIATAGEEAKNPQKSIPISVVTSLLIVFFAYFGVSTVLTMILPYYEQNENAPLPHIYNVLEWPTLKYVVSIGAMCGLFSSLLGAMFPLPRIIFAMACDGLLFNALSKVHPKFHTPFTGTLIAGALTGVLACLLELSKLTNMMSIGTLLAYSMVAACVLILRHSIDDEEIIISDDGRKSSVLTEDHHNDEGKLEVLQLMFNTCNQKTPTIQTASLVSWLTLVYFGVAFTFSGCIEFLVTDFHTTDYWIFAVLTVLLTVLFSLLLVIFFQPRSSQKLPFSVPFIPWIPGISILINVYLMTTLPADTWEKYAYWLIIGFVTYFAYSMWHSNEGTSKISTKVRTPQQHQ